MATERARGRLTAAVFVVALLVTVALGLARRSDPARARWSETTWGALDPDADYRRRLLTLALAQIDSHSVELDEFVGGGVGARAVGPFRALEWSAHSVQRAASAPRAHDESELDEAEARFASALEVCSIVASLAAAALVVAASRGTAAPVDLRCAGAALLAAGVVALSPLAVAREQREALTLDACQTMLALLQYAALGFGVRGRERIDAGLGALSGGALGGVALALGAQAWPTLAACALVWIGLAARRPRDGDRRRAWGVLLVALSAVCAFVACRGALDAGDLAPSWTALSLAECTRDPLRWALLAASLLCAWSLGTQRPRTASMTALVASLLVAAPCAFLDERFLAVNHAALALGSGLALLRGSAASRNALVSCVALLALALWPADSSARLTPALEERRGLHETLAELRQRDAAPGAFNHPGAAVDWRVASAPRLAGPIAHRARRPVLAVEFDGRASAAAPALDDALALADLAEFQRFAELNGVRYVLVCRAMVLDRMERGAQRDAQMLARWLDVETERDGWSLVHHVGRWRARDDASELAHVALWQRR